MERILIDAADEDDWESIEIAEDCGVSADVV